MICVVSACNKAKCSFLLELLWSLCRVSKQQLFFVFRCWHCTFTMFHKNVFFVYYFLKQQSASRWCCQKNRLKFYGEDVFREVFLAIYIYPSPYFSSLWKQSFWAACSILYTWVMFVSANILWRHSSHLHAWYLSVASRMFKLMFILV